MLNIRQRLRRCCIWANKNSAVWKNTQTMWRHWPERWSRSSMGNRLLGSRKASLLAVSKALYHLLRAEGTRPLRCWTFALITMCSIRLSSGFSRLSLGVSNQRWGKNKRLCQGIDTASSFSQSLTPNQSLGVNLKNFHSSPPDFDRFWTLILYLPIN